MNKILLFIPAYNCARQLARVLSSFDKFVQSHFCEILIVDNRSSDNTIEVARDWAPNAEIKYTVLLNDQNYNLGGSIKSAFLHAINSNYDFMVILHGDDQASIHDILPHLSGLHKASEELIIGARFHPESKLRGYSLVRIIGNRMLNFVCSMIAKKKVHDLIAGINCFKINFFKNKFFISFPDNLTFDAHVLLYAIKQNAGIKYFPITWREEDQVSNAKVVRQALIILKLFTRYIFTAGDVFETETQVKNYTSKVVTTVN